MDLELRKFTKFVDKTFIEGGKKAREPVLLVSVAAVFKNPWAEKGFVEDLKPIILDLAPKMHKKDSGLRPYYLTHEFTIHDAPFNDEIVIAIGGASSGRAHARTGDRYQDMKEMGLDPK